MSTMNNTVNTIENRNYIAEFYKNPEHNYGDFFGAYVADEKIEKVNKEIKSLFEQIDSKKEELSRLNTLRYNEMFTPTDKKLLLHYEPERGNVVEAYFDIVTGFAVNVNDYDGDEIGVTSVGRKAGEFQVVSGYCLPLGAIVLRYYTYKIATNNARCSFCLTKETIVPILDYDSPSFDNNGNWNNRPHYYQDATEFIRKMYNLPDYNYSVNIAQFCRYLENNKSTEIILRTAPESVLRTLLDMKVDKAEPINKILNLTKEEYDSLIEKDMLNEFITVQSTIRAAFSDSKRENQALGKDAFLHYTNEEWFDLIEKSHYWADELRFNQVGTNNDSPILSCLGAYLRTGWHYTTSLFYKYYSFGKFMDYVCEEASNQGFQSLDNFMGELRDYLSMCDTMNVKPTLYSGYLKQTHDILARNYKIHLDEEQEIAFAKQYEEFKDYVTKDKKYAIVHPSHPEDVKQEGYALNHCVSSYLGKICKGLSKIVFLRKAQETSKSLVTIEICEKAIVQARGASNRSVSQEEFSAICEYAKKNELKVRVSPRG